MSTRIKCAFAEDLSKTFDGIAVCALYLIG
jgi:hypothetical protein